MDRNLELLPQCFKFDDEGESSGYFSGIQIWYDGRLALLHSSQVVYLLDIKSDLKEGVREKEANK